VTAVTIDGSQNVGVGVTPSAWVGSTALQVGPSGSIAGNSSLPILLSANAYGTTAGFVAKYITSNYASTYLQYQGEHRWSTAPSGTAGNAITFTQAMTLDASGRLLLGVTSPLATAFMSVGGWSSVTYLGTVYQPSNSGAFTAVGFNNSAGTQQGYISCTGSGATSYVTTSDYRLKENIQPMTGALAKVQALNPVTYKFKYDGSDGQGFIAHELQAVVPDCVVGEKDAVDADGNPKYQGIDTSFLVATLTAAIQEQQALITQLQADVAALKG
jgi:hypothetical protein